MRIQENPLAPPSIKNFSVVVPESFNWGLDVIDRWGREKANVTALIYVGESGEPRRYTFLEVSERSNQLANFLLKHRIGKGDKVLLMLPNVPEIWLLIVALIKVGAQIIPSATGLTEGDLEYRMKTAEVKGVITDRQGLSKFSKILSTHRGQLSLLCLVDPATQGADAGWTNLKEAESEQRVFSPSAKTRADDPSIIYFTSGTEGPPKMVVHSQVSYPLGHRGTALWLGLGGGEVHWNISSPGWAKHAWSSVFAPWSVGATTFAFDYRGPFSAAKCLQKIGEFKVNSLCAAPTVWRMVLLEDLTKYDLSSLKSAASAGEPLNPEVIERFRNVTGVTIRDGYGQTETVLAIGNFPGAPVKLGSMGLPSPLYDIDVIDEDGKALKVGEEGNVGIRVSPIRPFAMLKEYAKDEGRNKAAFRNGWYYTGDRAFKDEEGYFWYVGRADDVIKSAGYRIGPFEVESALIKHPGVVESAVVAAPDSIRGAIVKAYVVLKSGYRPSQELADELASFVARETAPYKHPRKIEFVTSLDPVKTISGKTRRKALRKAEYGEEDRNVFGAEFNVKPMRETT